MVRDQCVKPYFQLYHDLDNARAMSGELLTRLESGGSSFELLGQLDISEHLELLNWLVLTSNDLLDSQGYHCSINVDNRVVLDTNDRQQFLEIAKSANGPRTFEFTETSAMPEASEANLLFRHLRELGHTCALDDFGTGLNGMTMLTDYDFDIVKVDRALTLEIDTRPEKLQVLALLNEMLKALNKSHVVEGVETEIVHKLLISAGYRIFQGYLLDMPKPVSELPVLKIAKEAS